MKDLEIISIKKASDLYFKEAFDLMKSSFPKAERPDKITLIERLSNNSYFNMNVILHNEQFVGILTYWVFNNFSYGEHIAFKENTRNKGFGSLLLQWIKDNLKMPFVIEVELPETEIAKRRIEFYERNGFVICKKDYTQPPYREEGESIPLYLMSVPIIQDSETIQYVEN
ncbi:MAG: GNAT family N-acetyltransferase, partial [Bacteroidales bacterium]